jgi:16S rRNA (cytosine967-C5)-methyltransferase
LLPAGALRHDSGKQDPLSVVNPAIIRNQQQTFGRLWRSLAPHVRSDRNLPTRLQEALRRRQFGSRDRRLYRELLYTALRHLPWVEELTLRSEEEAARAVAWLAADTPATHEYREALTAGWPPLPPTVAARARQLGATRELLPAWFRAHCPAAFVSPNLEALHTRAPLWIRLQTDAPDAVLDELTQRGWSWRRSEVGPDACEVLTEADLTTIAAYRDGHFEIQDLGSQLVLASVEIPRGGRWLDACAGAGGKTLQLARLLGPEGHVDAYDVRAPALAELRRRARRAGCANIRVTSRPPGQPEYDGVLVDAPCSGSGTWRRAPYLKWCTTPADVATQAARQQELLGRFSRLVRPGGRLIYATCSLSRAENESVVAAFLVSRPEFAVVPPQAPGATSDGPGLTILPALHDTDGFFVASLRREH